MMAKGTIRAITNCIEYTSKESYILRECLRIQEVAIPFCKCSWGYPFHTLRPQDRLRRPHSLFLHTTYTFSYLGPPTNPESAPIISFILDMKMMTGTYSIVMTIQNTFQHLIYLVRQRLTYYLYIVKSLHPASNKS